MAFLDTTEFPQVIRCQPFPSSEFQAKALSSRVQIIDWTREQILASPGRLTEVVGLLPLITDRIDAQVMDQLPDLKVIANYGTGVDNIDLLEATARGIQVTNTPGVLAESVADLTWGLILAASRHIVVSDQTMRTGLFQGWTPYFQLGFDVFGKTLGLIGFGQIGEAVARRAKGFSMKVFYTKRRPLSLEQEKHFDVTYESLETVLSKSDIVSVHVPLTVETHHLFNESTFSRMRPHSILINTSRGPIVDEAALAKVLKKGHLYAAGLDVFEQEPRVHPELLTLPNVVLTAHIGSATETTRQKMGDLAIQNLLSMLEAHQPLNPVNQLVSLTEEASEP